jgi:hypothetical protein
MNLFKPIAAAKLEVLFNKPDPSMLKHVEKQA